MATLPTDPMAAQATDPAMMGADPETQETADTGYTICIRVEADGTLRVGVEDESAEATAEQGEDPGMEADEYASFQEAKDIKEALTMALQIYKADGQAAAEAQFDNGFKGM